MQGITRKGEKVSKAISIIEYLRVSLSQEVILHFRQLGELYSYMERRILRPMRKMMRRGLMKSRGCSVR